MATNPTNTQLALGCEDGCVRLIDITGGALAHSRRFDRVKAKLLSIAWGPPSPPAAPASRQVSCHSSFHLSWLKVYQDADSSDDDEDEDEWTDSWLVTGGSDSSLRKWDAKTGRSLERMTVDKARGERTLVWTVGVLAYVFYYRIPPYNCLHLYSDGTIVSGDSFGTVKFWDARTSTQLHSFTAHGADVLCLAIGPVCQTSEANRCIFKSHT